MTPSASASPIVLLAPAAAPAGVATSAENTAPPALDGGFQLLVDVAAQQQLAAQFAGNTPKPQTGEVGQGGEAPVEAGNVLPLPGLILPSGDGEPALAEPTGKKAEDTDKGDAALPAAASTATIPVPWVPINIQPQQPVAKSAGSRTSGDLEMSVDTDLDVAAPAAATTAPAPATPDANAAAVATAGTPVQPVVVGADTAGNTSADADGIQLGAPGMSIPAAVAASRQAGADRAAQPALDASLNPAVEGTGASAAGGAGTRKGGDVASFADALKPAVAAAENAQSSAPAAGAVDVGRSHAPTRSYLDVNNATPTAATVAVPVGSSGWSDAVVDKVMWFSANQINSAEIKLNPPDLGPLHVRISTQQDQTSVVFTSPHAAVRDALDQALPRLRDMFGGQGLQLADASVGGQAQRQQQQGAEQQAAQGRSSNWSSGEDSGDVPVAVSRVVAPRHSTSAVDAYA